VTPAARARRGARVGRALTVAAATVLLSTACASVVHGAGDSASQLVTSSEAPTPPASSPASTSATQRPTTSAASSSATHSAPSRSSVVAAPAPPAAVPAGTGPLIVIDPGHSVTVHGTDPATGLDVSDYENEPEMRDVYAVARLVRQKLLAAGYRVLMTKPTLDTPTTLGRRAQVANDSRAALAVSIHDQAGSDGGIAFASGNNTVYYQAVGDYRTTPSGRKVVFTDAAVAATSERYGQLFQRARAAKEGHSVAVMGNTGYDLGSRGLQGGNIWIVQLLSKVPWIYCEAGGNSAGQSGLNATDRQRYADGIVAGVESSVPA
jgi:N-acetylmuramoyl-L-alanine amidase